jgi:hypothetical protein
MCTVLYSAERRVSVVLTTYDLAIRDLALLRKQGAGSDRYLMLLALPFISFYPFPFPFFVFLLVFIFVFFSFSSLRFLSLPFLSSLFLPSSRLTLNFSPLYQLPSVVNLMTTVKFNEAVNRTSLPSAN